MNSLMAVFRFEARRMLTPGRSAWWLLVAAFPAVITLLMSTYLRLDVTSAERQQEIAAQLDEERQREAEFQRALRSYAENQPPGAFDGQRNPGFQADRGWERPRHRRPPIVTQQDVDTIYSIALYFLGPAIACMLGALLTAAPSVASELEQHSWVYFATRPNGLFHLVVGKYLVAVTWSASATTVGILAALPLSKIEATTEAGLALISLSLISSCCYSALYMMIGTLFPQRAMVFCVAYTAAVEIFMGFLPAVINRMTVQYRLRTLLFRWTTQSDGFEQSGVLSYVASGESVFLQLAWLCAFTALFLAVALTTIHVREFTQAAETDV